MGGAFVGEREGQQRRLGERPPEELASAFNADVYVAGTRPLAAAVTASAGSYPTVASRTAARSATLRDIGPPVSCVRPKGMTPARLDSPAVGPA